MTRSTTVTRALRSRAKSGFLVTIFYSLLVTAFLLVTAQAHAVGPYLVADPASWIDTWGNTILGNDVAYNTVLLTQNFDNDASEWTLGSGYVYKAVTQTVDHETNGTATLKYPLYFYAGTHYRVRFTVKDPYGPNLVSNSTFDTNATGWSLGAGWIWENQYGYWAHVHTTSDDAGNLTLTSWTPTVGHTYKIKSSINYNWTGSVVYSMGGVDMSSSWYGSPINTVTATTTDPLVIACTGGGCRIDVDDVYIYEPAAVTGSLAVGIPGANGATVTAAGIYSQDITASTTGMSYLEFIPSSSSRFAIDDVTVTAPLYPDTYVISEQGQADIEVIATATTGDRRYLSYDLAGMSAGEHTITIKACVYAAQPYGTPYCGASSQPFTFRLGGHYYVDPVNGSDSNDGLSLGAPRKTIKRPIGDQVTRDSITIIGPHGNVTSTPTTKKGVLLQ